MSAQFEYQQAQTNGDKHKSVRQWQVFTPKTFEQPKQKK